MFIARWQFTAKSGQTDKCVELLRHWEIDVGAHIGWKPGAVRVVTGFVGAPLGEVEFETHFESLNDLESAWSHLTKLERHKTLMAQLEPLMVSGTHRWNLYRVVELIPAG